MVYQYDQLNRVTRLRENNAASGLGVLATYSYTPTGQRAAVTYGNGTTRTYAYDTAGRTTGVKLDLAGAERDLVIGAVVGAGTPVSYNPAGQIVSLSRCAHKPAQINFWHNGNCGDSASISSPADHSIGTAAPA